jgi:RNA polymerase primary sigma factor
MRKFMVAVAPPSNVPDSSVPFLEQLSRYSLLTAAEEVQLAKRIEAGDREAKEKMINSNLRLIAKREIADAVGLSVKQIVETQKAPRTVTSLDKPIGDEGATLGELMVAPQPEPHDQVESSAERETLRLALTKLPRDERQVLELRFGITREDEPQTVKQVIRRLHISRNRVQRLEASGLTRLGKRREVQALR